MIANIDHIQTPDELAEIGMPRVKWWTTRFADRTQGYPGIYPDDIESSAMQGLMLAIKKYHPTKGAKFTTYCNTMIKYSILSFLREAQGTREWVSDGRRLVLGTRTCLYDEVTPNSGDGVMLEIDNHRSNREEKTADVDARLDMRSLFDKVSRQTALMLAMRYIENMTFKDIAKALGVTESRVSQLHTKLKPMLVARIHGRQVANA